MDVELKERVRLGTWVRVTGFVPGVESVFHLVSDADTNWRKHKVSTGTVLGRALLGARVGDTIRLGPEDDQLRLKVRQVGCDYETGDESHSSPKAASV